MTSTPVSASLDPDRLAPEADDPEVGTVMRDEVVFCLPSTPADAIAKLLNDNILSELVVLVDRRPVGYVAKEDVINHLVEGDIVVAGSDFAVRPPSTAVQARDMLRQSPLLVDEHQRLSEVVALMAQHERRLAVITHEDETVVGMITPRELADFRLARRQVVHA
ncbi:MAG TPA: CBS domain-containing protein [Candidatus Dormibacteraeota bacterium]